MSFKSNIDAKRTGYLKQLIASSELHLIRYQATGNLYQVEREAGYLASLKRELKAIKYSL